VNPNLEIMSSQNMDVRVERTGLKIRAQYVLAVEKQQEK
jgi:hypothetical protein